MSELINKFKVVGIILKDIFISIGVLFFIFMEELIWDTFVTPIKKYFEKIISKEIKILISKQHKYVIMLLFLLPFVTSEFMGIVSGILFTLGLIPIALIIYGAKIVVASISLWIFSNNKDKLLSIALFRKGFDIVMYIFNYLKTIRIYKDIKKTIADIKKAGKSDFIKILKHKYKSYKNKFKKEE